MKSAVCLFLLSVSLSLTGLSRTWLVGPEESLKDPQMALENAQSNDTILIREGEYRRESFMLQSKEFLVILGENAQLLGTDPYGSVLMVSGCNSLIISGLKMRHELGAQWEICFGGVLEIASCRDVLITDCEMNGCGAIGLDVFGSSGVACVNSYIHHNNRSALRYEWHQVNDPDSMKFDGLLMHNNRFADNGTVIFKYPWVEGLRIRESYPDGEVVGTLEQYERVYDLGEKSDTQSTIELRGRSVTDYWVRIQTDTGLSGWVFGGALSTKRDAAIQEGNFYPTPKGKGE